MELGRIKNTEIDSEKITASDIANICYEIAKHSKKAHRIFNNNKLKSKYVKYGKFVKKDMNHDKAFVEKHAGKLLMQAEIEEAIQKGNQAELSKVFEKYDVKDLISLGANIEITRDMSGPKTYYKVSETEGKGRVNPLITMYDKVQKDAREKVENRSAIASEQKHQKEVEEITEKINRENHKKIVADNKRKDREDFSQSMNRTNAMDSFAAETRGKVESEIDAAMKMYGDSDSGRAYTEIKKARDSMPDYLNRE